MITRMSMMNMILASQLLVFFICVIAEAHARKTLYTDDGICKRMVETQGYTCEEHKVTTVDGYILSLQRMPAGRSGKAADKPPVLLQHGLFIDAITWLFNTPEESLAYILADKGFDVWLANTRGTKYSSAHTSLSPNDMVILFFTF
ncbi:Triacylglycerol lipase [Arachis hypogaea]|nr:Triacylglycerol lipase [Arachis hypogaea]